MSETDKANESERCCCGRIVPWTEPIIFGDTMHERLGDKGAFCGPVIKHELRDALVALEACRAQNTMLRRRLKPFADYADRAKEAGLPHTARIAYVPYRSDNSPTVFDCQQARRALAEPPS